MKETKKKIDEEKEIEKERERLDILQKSSEPKGMMNIIDIQGEFKTVDERSQLILSDTDDPDKKYALYYKEIEKMLKMVINPKLADDNTKKAFKILREEKNILLTQGKRKNERGIRGRDARMGYSRDMELAAGIIADAVLAGSSPLELYQTLRDKNIELGYYDDLKGKLSTNLKVDDKIQDVLLTLRAKKGSGK